MTALLHFAVGHVGFEIAFAEAGWAAPLAPLYTEFPLTGPADWRITVRYDPALLPAAPRWITHDATHTRFHLIRIAGELDLATRQAEVTTVDPDLAASALERVAAYACMHTLLHRHDSLLLHAGGIYWQGRGLVVTGHSGAGKTTLTRLALGYGEPFNDEMVIVDLSGPRPLLRSTPFIGFRTPPELRTRVNRVHPADCLLVLAHGAEFRLDPLPPAEAVLELLRTDIAAVERPASAARWMALAERLLQQVPARRLVFRPTPDVWSFLAHALETTPCAS